MTEEQMPEKHSAPEKASMPKKLSVGERVVSFIWLLIFGTWFSFLLFAHWKTADGSSGHPAPLFVLIHLVLMSCVFLVCLVFAFRCLGNTDKLKWANEKLRVFVVLSCFSPFAFALVFSGVNQYKSRANNSDSKSNLHQMYLGCKAYWAEQGAGQECDVSKVATQEYGYVQSTRVSIYGKGTETTFSATAQHMDSTTSYMMDSNGNIE